MSEDFPYELTDHAAHVVKERDIPLHWVKTVLENPQWLEPDREDPAILHALAQIAEFGGRVLRVVYRREPSIQVVTVFFDRKRRKSP